MHVLTKIFIVLVSLLAVLLVPLVVVYSHNEDAYKDKFAAEQSQKSAAMERLSRAEAEAFAREGRLQNQIQELTQVNQGQIRDMASKEKEINDLQARLISAESLQKEINSKLASLTSSVEAGQGLTESLVDELRGLRGNLVQKERQLVELDEALRDSSGQLEVAQAAVRALQEELQRLSEEHAGALEQVGAYVGQFGEIGDIRINDGLIAPDRHLQATIISVRRNAEEVLAEIDAGSRDGVKEGWSMTIGNGGFVANLRIIEVDLNRSTGIVTLESSLRGTVQIGNQAYAFPDVR